jgi:hypothetical protein
MRSQLIVGFVEIAFDGGVPDGAVHPLDLAVGPGMLRFGVRTRAVRNRTLRGNGA